MASNQRERSGGGETEASREAGVAPGERGANACSQSGDAETQTGEDDAGRGTRARHSARLTAAPLAAVLAIVVLHSIGTAVIWHVIFYIAEDVLAYSRQANLTLAVVTGGCYTVSAFLSGGLIDRFRRSRGVPLRGVLVGLLAGSGLFAAAPAALGEVGLWLFATVYSVLTGMVWPTVEAFLAGGRQGRGLRAASGRFNICWSSAVVVGSVVASPLVPMAPNAILFGLAAVHAVTIVPALMLTRDPAAEAGPPAKDDDDPHAPAPDLARSLLTAFRALNFSSYTLLASLSPVLPHMLEAFAVPKANRTALGGTWMLTRVAAFVIFERWHGWHSSRWTPVLAAGLLLVGFVGAFGATSEAMLIGALGVLGCGAGVAYAGAIYYAVHAQAGHVDAGGKHEGFIGLGYTLGPVLGFAILAAV
jgi:MFS family permease